MDNKNKGKKEIKSKTQNSTDKPQLGKGPEGLMVAGNYPLLKAIFNRRSRRIMKGLKNPIMAGDLTYTPAQNVSPLPLSELEEALLIAVIGKTGLVMPDRPFRDAEDKDILGTPNIRMTGRAAGSADNAQNTHFFMLNDKGTYYLQPQPPDEHFSLDKDKLIASAKKTKVRLGPRLDFERRFPFYLDSNRFLSNFPGSTIFVPVVDMAIQYINGLMSKGTLLPNTLFPL